LIYQENLNPDEQFAWKGNGRRGGRPPHWKKERGTEADSRARSLDATIGTAMRERDLKALEFDKVLALAAAHGASEPGREAVIALRPSIDPLEVRRRLRLTAELAELRSHAGALPMQEFVDQRQILLVAARAGSILDGVSLVAVRNFVIAARTVDSFLRSRVESFPNLAALAQSLAAPKELADALMSTLADDGGLLDDASPELKRLRNRLRDGRLELEGRLMRALSASGMEPIVSDNVVTVRNRRFVLPLKLNYADRLEGIVQDRSVSGETLFVEPMWAIELNNRLMMLEREAEAEERRILEALTAMVRGYARELRLTFDTMVKLDALNACAIFAERFRCIEPEIVAAGIELAGARHPILIQSGREAVPIDIRIGPEQRGIVISGPNMGGKTVALKTLGLFALMAQTGMLIPAGGGSTLPVFHGIFADIGDEQSIEANLSSFAAHIANLSEIVNSLIEPALVILDEPGAGTDPAEGSALTIGLMSHLAGRKVTLAIATHSTAVKLHAYSRAGFEAAAVDFDAERLVPLYRLKPHTMGQSYGIAVARRLGLPEEVIRAAEEARPAGSLELERALDRLEAERAEFRRRIDELRNRETVLAERERLLAEESERARHKAATERARLRADTQSLIEELRRDGSKLLEELKAHTKSQRDLSRFIAEAGRKLEQIMPAVEEAGPAEEAQALKVGDEVQLGAIRGELIALEPGKAVVSRGGMRIEVAPERLRRAPQVAVSRRAQTVSVIPAPREETDELMLIGMRAGDALRKLEEFLDQAYLANKPEVRIVHGIGSGALKKAVHEYLSTSPYCASFREAEPRAGGAGATVVQLSS
jgi:DNA mismatch repair protein MutS2